MKLIYNLTIVCCVLMLMRCSQKPEKDIVHLNDYASYLDKTSDKALDQCNEEMAFWNTKLLEVPTSETYRTRLASLFSARFMLNGRVEDIQTSDSLYHVVQAGTPIEYASLHRSQAANCITQHQFREAFDHIQKAITIGEGKAASLFMLVDVDIELGDYAGAETVMRDFKNKNFFPYLIREAKLKDHEGQIDSAMVIMEKALNLVKEDRSLSLWTKSNLADMYGHAGRVEDAYALYLDVLRQNPDYDYALKGIAWIAFSHDHNFTEAKRIIHAIEHKRATPDLHLLLAQIAAAENDIPEKIKQLDIFTHAAAKSKYGAMYNKYIALLDAEELSDPDKTIEIAKIEVRNRPTPQSYDLLAWGYLRKGDASQALAIARERVENKTFEPDAFYHLGMIYLANGRRDEARHYFEKAAASSFELGPSIAKKIREQLNS